MSDGMGREFTYLSSHTKAGWKLNDFHDSGPCPENPLVFCFSKTIIL